MGPGEYTCILCEQVRRGRDGILPPDRVCGWCKAGRPLPVVMHGSTGSGWDVMPDWSRVKGQHGSVTAPPPAWTFSWPE